MISTFKPQRTSEPLYPGGKILSVDRSGDLALIGGSEGIAGIYSIPENRVLRVLRGGGGSITGGAWAGSKAIVSTSAGRVEIFEEADVLASFSTHAGEVADLAVHPSGDIAASVGVDKSFVLYDMTASAVVTQVYSNSGGSSMPSTYDVADSRDQLLRACSSILMAIYWLLEHRTARLSSSMLKHVCKPPLLT